MGNMTKKNMMMTSAELEAKRLRIMDQDMKARLKDIKKYKDL